MRLLRYYFSYLTFCVAYYLFGIGYPFDTPFFRPASRFSDFTHHVISSAKTYSPYFAADLQDRIYNPFIYFFSVYVIDTKFKAIFAFVFSILVTSYIIFRVVLNGYGRRSGILYSLLIVFLVISSYPYLFAFDRLNVDLLSLALLFYYLYSESRSTRAIILGIIIAIKLTNVVFIAIPILKRRGLIEIIASVSLALSLNYLSLYAFIDEPTHSLSRFFNNLHVYVDFYSGSFVAFSHSFRNIIKFSELLKLNSSLFDMIYLIMYYFATCILFFNFVLIYILKYRIPDSILYLNIVCTLCLLSTASPDYRLIFFSVPLVCLLVEDRFKFRNAFILLIAVISLPKNFSISRIIPSFPLELHIGVLINPLLIFTLVLFIFAYIYSEICQKKLNSS